MTGKKDTQATGVIIIRESTESNDFCSLHIPDAGSNQTVVLRMNQGDCKDKDPRFIELNSFPSATKILLTRNDNGTPDDASWWIELKTTRNNAALDNEEITYLNTYDVGSFIEQGIGVMVIAKHGTIQRDELRSVRVVTSAAPPRAERLQR
ncbi:hypothetical protein D3C76_481150 [compost metagenome]|jgi:hypothetical protein|uniref:Lipoprotein n=2 Tax=Pseudomonas TaxID=286 RepID=A0ABY7RCZ3_9PSED|nr:MULTISPECIES: hypothetical protein [Pseudomonas]MDD2066645.1 hypothetical protein [Pseudomonas sp. 25571]MUT54197.1 hypothetical protein [Pseudomonas sp. TDA1]UDU82696.1 hypothetical protein LJX93_06985 [Pseudomonas sp. HN2-3]WCI01656.1 hypothetical protein PMC74_07095 [Pseudomonas capeferrum]